PHLGGGGAGQTAFFDGSRGYVSKKGTWLAVADMMNDERTAGYLGHGDGYDQLHQDRLTNRYRRAGPGRVTLTWRMTSNSSAWPRDLYHAANGLLAAGDVATASDVLRFMGKQQRPDGSMPQNTDLGGKPVWTGQQLDETADAILLAARLGPGVVGPSITGAAN